MHGSDVLKGAMINRNVILLRSEQIGMGVDLLYTVLFVVIFTSRMNANQIMRELIIIKYTQTFYMPRMMTLESGVVFVVHVVVERRIMHALTLHIHK